MNINTSIQSLDPKASIPFLSKIINYTPSQSKQLHLNTDIIHEIPNFLLDCECNEIINKCNSTTNGFTSLDYCEASRIISFDQNENLIKTIKLRLAGNGFLDICA